MPAPSLGRSDLAQVRARMDEVVLGPLPDHVVSDVLDRLDLRVRIARRELLLVLERGCLVEVTAQEQDLVRERREVRGPVEALGLGDLE